MEESPPKNSLPVTLVRWLFFLILIPAAVGLRFYGCQFYTQSMGQKLKLSQNEPVSMDKPRSENRLLSFFGKKVDRYRPIIHQAARRYQVDPAIVKAIIMAESGYNPRAISKKGAMGLMQLMPETAEALGVEDSFNPEHNINAGVRYFKQLMDQFDGDVELAIAAYNAGSRKVRMYQGVPPFKATRRYVKKVFEYHQYYRNQMKSEPGKI